MMHFIGIDIGTSSVCGVVYNFSDQKIESINKTNDSSITASHTWEKIQDPDKIMGYVIEIITEFSIKFPDIKGIGITGQMHGILYVDDSGNAVSPLYTWQDGRGNLLYGNQSYAEYLSEVTGYPLATGFGLVTHFYNQENNLVPDKAKKICTIMDYVVMKLSGRTVPLTDYSNGAGLGCFDKQNNRFDELSLGRAGVDISVLPDAKESATFAGYYSDTIPVYSAIGDNQASFLGSVKDINKSIHITVGTSSQISVYTDEYIEIESLDTRPFPGGGFILVGAALCGGQSLAIIKNFFEKVLKLLNENNPDEINIYKVMNSIPYKTGEADLPVVETLFDGTRSEPSKRGSITNISNFNLTPENLILGFMKGICNELYDFYNILPDNIKKNKALLIGSGNAIKKNPLLCEAFKDRFGCELNLTQYEEEAAFGACMCAIAGGKF